MIDIHMRADGENIGPFAGLKTVSGNTYVKYVDGWDRVSIIPLELVSFGKQLTSS